MGREIAGDCNEDVAALVGVTPYAELPNSGLQHLIGEEAVIFPQDGAREGGDQRLWWVAEREMPRHEPCRDVDLALPVEGIEQGGANRLRFNGEVIEL